MTLDLPGVWTRPLAPEFEQPYFAKLSAYVNAERHAYTVYPPEKDVFRALRETPLDRVRVVIVGQDPYHDAGQAHGLAFSIPVEMKLPPSLKNIFKELASDLPELRVPENGCLTPWAQQGVLLLNTVLTVRAHAAGSHRAKGWERFTDAILRSVDRSESPVVFVLWGDHAQKKIPMIDVSRHSVIRSAHPSPLSAYRGFFGSRPFSRINHQLEKWRLPLVDWSV